ncbi:uncharacterized protein LOC134293023 [Anolis carolinensis]|uniref:uncharacterized protein LOC134293023 n=1 Tax=Anolis carolinensis TaxID=28377 RepID=UPI002F2B20F9
MSCKGKNVLIGFCIGFPLVLCIAFLAAYLDLKSSDAATQVETCRTELQNQKSSAQDGVASLQRRLEALVKAEKEATALAKGLRTQLVTAQQGFAQAEKNWESCRNQMKTLVQNFTAEMGNATQQEAKRCQAETDKLQSQLSKQTQKLEEAQKKNHQQREDCEARIHQIRAEQNQSSRCSRAAIPETSIMAFLAFAFLFLP